MDDQAVDRIFIGDLDDLPPVSSKIVRIFTSSTFTDTSLERNTLMEEVYPKIKEYCREKHGLEFQVVDMRWGVRDEATDDHMTTDLCMREIKNCQRLSMGPNFVVFLGQKYGYRPIPTIILGSEFTMLREALVETQTDTSLLDMWYKLDTNSVPPVYILQPISTILVNFCNKRVPKLQAQDQATWWDTLGKMQKVLRQAAQKCFDEGKMDKDARHNYFMSVTEREVINGVLNVKNTKNHCLAYFRYINNINTGNVRAACKYIDMINRAVDTEAVRLLANLRDERVPAKLETTNIVRFHVEWIGKEGLDVDTHEEYLQQFITHFYKSIIKLVDRAMRKEDRSALGQIVTEILQHLQACVNSVKVFHGREEELARLEKYVKGKNNQPFVLHGTGGCGKTSMLAKVASLVTGWLPEAKPMLILRFLGTTPDSSTVAPLLSSLCRQIAYNFMMPLEEIPEEIVPLTVYLKNLLALATPDQGLAIFLDSVDQLASGQEANKMSWLPVFLPPNVKVVLSCVSDADCIADFTMLQKMFDNPDNFLEIKPLGQELATHVIREWLKSAHRDLTEYHWELVESVIAKCTLPIFVKLVFAEICRWKSYTRSQETQLASNVNDSIMKLFDRIELQHGKTLVFHALAYITCAKSGLSESELEDIISLDDVVLEDVYQYHMPPVRRIPPLLWTRIRSDLPNYLSEREADGVSVANWYHRQFRDAATERYFKNQNLAMYFHSSVAEYFLGTWGGGTPKPFKYTELQRQRFGLTDKEGSADRKVPLQPLVFLSKDGKVSRYNLRKFGELPYHLVRARRFEDLFEHVFFKYEWLHAKLSSCPLQAVLSDFEDAHRHLTDKDIKREILLVADAMRLGGAILSQYPDMLAPQLIGRLLPEMHNNERVRGLLEQCDSLGPNHCGLLPIGHCMHTPGGPLKYSLEGHQFAVFGFCLTSDNKYIVSVSNRFIMWDLSTSDISRNNDLNIEGIVQFLTLSPDDRFAAGYTNNNEIVLINALTGDIKHLYEFVKSKDTIQGAQVTESYLYVWSNLYWLQYDFTGKVVNKQILSNEKTDVSKVLEVKVYSIHTYHVILWTGEDENPSMKLQSVHEKTSLEPLFFRGALVMNKAHNVVYTCIDDDCIQQMKITGNRWAKTKSLVANEERIQQLRLWEDNGYLVATVMTGFKLWHLESNYVKTLLLPHDVRNISVKPMHSNTAAVSKGNLYLVAGVRKFLYVWDLKTEELLKTLDAHFGRIMQLVPFIDDEWNSVITSSIDRSVKVWNINNIFEQVHIIDRHDLPIDSISLSPQTNRAVTATRSCVGVWNMRTTKLVSKIVESPVGAIVTHALITGNGRHLVTIENGQFLIWKVEQKTVLRRDEHKNVRQLLLFAKDTRALAVSRESDNKAHVVVRSVPEGEKIYEMEYVYKIFRPMVISVDNRYLVAMGYEKGKECLFVYEGHSGKFIHKIVPKYSKMKEVNHLVAMPNRSSYVTLIDVDKGTIIDIKNKKVVRSVARWNGKCTRDGKYGLYAPTRGGLELIELRHGNTVRTFIPRIAEGVYAVDTAFTKTDEYVLYYHAKHQTVRVFRVEDAAMLANFKLPAEMTAIDCAPDGYSVIVGTADGAVTLLTIVDPEKPASREHLSRLPSRQDPNQVKQSSGISFRTAARITQLALSATAAFKPGVDSQVKSKVCSLQ